MYAGKRCNSRSNLTKRYKLDRVASVDNRPPPDKNFGPKQMWPTMLGPGGTDSPCFCMGKDCLWDSKEQQR